jgi:hypothetical protein
MILFYARSHVSRYSSLDIRARKASTPVTNQINLTQEMKMMTDTQIMKVHVVVFSPLFYLQLSNLSAFQIIVSPFLILPFFKCLTLCFSSIKLLVLVLTFD